MKTQTWLKRKYPNSYKDINLFLNEEYLNIFKTEKYKIGKLTEDLIYVGKYKKGDLILFKRSNPVTSYNYPMHNAIIKCASNMTSSGYHSIDIYEGQFEELSE